MTAPYRHGDIEIQLEKYMKSKGVTLAHLAQKIGITAANLSILKNNKAKGIRFGTLHALCKELDCEPGDIIKVNRSNGYRVLVRKIPDEVDIAAVKLLRENLGLTLPESVAMLQKLPATVLDTRDRQKAVFLYEELQTLGADIVLEEED